MDIDEIEDDNAVTLDYREGDNYYALLIKTSLLTFVTLGLYRFWQTAALRRYYWSSIAIDGDSLEYSGTGVETFIGFLFALVIASIYLGIFVVIGSFAGLVIFENLTFIQYFAIASFVPIFYFARYRFRRYLLSRTIWRGIRLGLDKGAWGYVWRGCAFLLLSVVSLGIMEPFGRYKLEKYVNDRVRVGDKKMQLDGQWYRLYRYFWPLYVVVIIVGVIIAYKVNFGTAIEAIPYILVGLLFTIVAYAYYIVRSQLYFMNNRSIGDAINFRGSFRTRSVFGRYAIGYGFAILAALIVFYAIFLIVIVAAATANVADFAGYGGSDMLEDVIIGNDEVSLGQTIGIVIGFISVYLSAILAFEITRQVFVTQPVAKYIARNVHIQSKDALATIGQGDIDDIRDADGFADALDVGFGF